MAPLEKHPAPKSAGSAAPAPPAVKSALPAGAWMALGVLAEAGYLAWTLCAAASADSTAPGPGFPYAARLALYLLLFLPPLAAALLARRPATRADLNWALLLAALFRLTLLPAPPVLSDDIYRYIWDGRVQAHGINPYRYAPDDPALADLRDAQHHSINHPDVPTIYPPLSQISFAAIAHVSGTVWAFKAMSAAVEIGCWVVLARIWSARGLSFPALVLYLWNPLVVLEGSGSGHNDALGVSLLLCASLLIILGRPALSITALAGSIAAKLFPLLALPAWLKATPRRYWILPPLLWIALWAPYVGAGPRIWEGLSAYGHHWEQNAFLFRGLRLGVEWVNPKPALDRWWSVACAEAGRPELASWIWPYTEPRQLAKGVVALGLAGTLIGWLRRRAEPPWVAFRMLGAALLWAPTVHPWYLQWVLPFAAWYGSRAWFVFSASAFLSYAPEGWTGAPPEVLLWIEYVPFLAVWVWEELRRRSDPRAGAHG